MQFDRSLAPSEVGPVKHRQGDINEGRIEIDQFVLRFESLFSQSLVSTAIEELDKEALAKFPGAMGLGAGQGGVAGGRDTKVFHFPLTASQVSGNLPERMNSAQSFASTGNEDLEIQTTLLTIERPWSPGENLQPTQF